MSEVPDQGATSGQGAAGAASGGRSAGALIRHAREEAGVHIAALAVSLKVPVKRLEALEADRYDLLPDAVFVRALASSVCRSLKLDPDAVLPLLPKGEIQPLSVEGNINEPFRPHEQGVGPGLLQQLSRPAVMAGAVLVLAAVVVYLLPDFPGPAQAPAPVAQPAAPAAAPAASDPATPPVPAVAPGTVVESVQPPVTPQAAPGAPAQPAVPVAPVPSVVPAPSPAR